jgi:hypothetical protein
MARAPKDRQQVYSDEIHATREQLIAERRQLGAEFASAITERRALAESLRQYATATWRRTRHSPAD